MSDKKLIFDAMVQNIREYAHENGLNIILVAEHQGKEHTTCSVVVGNGGVLVDMFASAIVHSEDVASIAKQAMLIVMEREIAGNDRS